SFSASLRRASPERTSPVNSFSSRGSLIRRPPGLARRSSGDGEVMFRSDDPDLRLFQDAPHERILLSYALREFRCRVDRRVDLPSERRARIAQNGKNVAVRHAVTDHHQVDIAL